MVGLGPRVCGALSRRAGLLLSPALDQSSERGMPPSASVGGWSVYFFSDLIQFNHCYSDQCYDLRAEMTECREFVF